MRYRFFVALVACWGKRKVQKIWFEGRSEVADVSGPDPHQVVYGISVAAELVGMGVQNLRAYEARGLLEPERTDGGTRRYSTDDLERLRRIGDLLDAGLNLAGISMVLDLETQNSELRAEKERQGTKASGRH
jgi:MerR family transcriptional regulator, heat shock protein HspR